MPTKRGTAGRAATPKKKAASTANQSNNKGGYKLRDEKAIARFAKHLRAVIDRANADAIAKSQREGRRPRPLTHDDIAYASRLPDGTGGISKQTVSKLLRGLHGPDVRTLKALARALHGYTSYDELAHAAGIETDRDDRPPIEKIRSVMVAEDLPGYLIEEAVAFLEFRLNETAADRGRKAL